MWVMSESNMVSCTIALPTLLIILINPTVIEQILNHPEKVLLSKKNCYKPIQANDVK